MSSADWPLADPLAIGRRVLAEEAEALQRTATGLGADFAAAVQAVLDCWSVGAWVPAVVGANGTLTDPWLWTPVRPCAAPLLEHLTATSWCAIHKGTSILLVGDSLTTQQYDATRLMLGSSSTDDAAVQCDSRSDLEPFLDGCDAFTA